MNLTKIRAMLASLIGHRYRELPAYGPQLRQAIEETLAELHASKCGESGTPCCEVNNEYYRIGGRKLCICTEDEMDVSLWGPKKLVDEVYAKIMEKWKARMPSQ